jgi:hypothetical protein
VKREIETPQLPRYFPPWTFSKWFWLALGVNLFSVLWCGYFGWDHRGDWWLPFYCLLIASSLLSTGKLFWTLWRESVEWRNGGRAQWEERNRKMTQELAEMFEEMDAVMDKHMRKQQQRRKDD